MVEAVDEQQKVKDAWMATKLDVHVDQLKQSAPAHTAPAKNGKEPPELGHQTNPFDAPEFHVAIEKLALQQVQALTGDLALAAQHTFATAITNVKAKKKAEAEEEQARKELIMTIVVTVALMPAGPVVEAVAAGLSGQTLRSKLADAIADGAPALEKKFGAAGTKAADKAFNIVASEQVGKLADSFDAAKAKSALEAGMDKLKDKSVKFAANSDKGKAVESYLDALQESANHSMPNLLGIIHTTENLSAAVAYYNLFSGGKLQASYEAALTQQVEDMLSELNDAIVEHGEEQYMGGSDTASTYGLDEIAVIPYRGRQMLAHVTKVTMVGAFLSGKPSWSFMKWVTPDMEETAAKMVKDHLTIEDFKGQHIPDPMLEPGERVVSVKNGAAAQLMLITVEDKHGWFSTDYGVCTFKQWASTEKDTQAFNARGALQNGGINEMKIGDIKDVPKTS